VRLDYARIYSKHIPEIGNKTEGQVLVKCIFHDDEHPSLSINLDEGIFHCFGCNVSGNIDTFLELVGEKKEKEKRKQSKEDVLRNLYFFITSCQE